MCQRNTNKLRMPILLGVLLVTIVFISGCTQVPEEESAEGQPSITTPTEKSTEITLPKGSSAGKIAFTSGGSVYVINYDGTGRVKLAEGTGLYWSPDGKRLLIVGYPVSVSRYSVINYDGTGKVDLGLGESYSTWAPTWAPRGKIIWTGGPPINPKDTEINEDDKINEEYVRYDLSPDGKKIAYINKYYNLIVVNNDGTNKIRLVPLEVDPRRPSSRELGIAWSPDSKKIVHGGYGLINIDGTGGTTLTSMHDERIVSWSPDGKMIAYQDKSGESRQSTRYSLVVVAADNPRNAIARVAAGESPFAYVREISWSPDGKRILYYVSGLHGDGYHVIDVGTGSVTSIIGGQPKWSPDGKKLFNRDPTGIYVINADGTGRIYIGKGEKPEWMGDNKRIVYQYTEKFGEEVVGEYIYVVNADGTGRIKLTEGQNPVPSPATE